MSSRIAATLVGCLVLVTAQTAGAAQAAPELPADPAERAFTCDIAVMATDTKSADGQFSFVAATRAAQFYGLRIVAQSGGVLSPDHPIKDWDDTAMAELKLRMNARFLPNHAREILALCDAAYPQSQESFPVRLPPDADERLFSCMGLAFWITKTGYPAHDHGKPYLETAAYVALGERLVPKIKAAMEARGLPPGPEATRVLTPPIGRAFSLGRPDKVLDACIAAYPA
jgi:hypothetical protein